MSHFKQRIFRNSLSLSLSHTRAQTLMMAAYGGGSGSGNGYQHVKPPVGGLNFGMSRGPSAVPPASPPLGQRGTAAGTPGAGAPSSAVHRHRSSTTDVSTPDRIQNILLQRREPSATNSSKLLPTAASPSLARTSFAAGSERSGHQGPRPAAVLAATDPPIADLFDEVSRREDTVSVVATTQQLANTSMVGHDQSMVSVARTPVRGKTPRRWQRLETDEAALEGRLPDGRHQLACVTIFGFGLADLDLVMTEFERCGRILRRETKTNCNWLHVQFDDQLSAQRALSKHGMVLSARLMVGVQPCLDEEFLRNAVESRSRTEMGVLSTPVRKTPIRDLSARSRVTAGAGFEPQGQTSGPVPATPQPSSYMKSLRDYVLGW